MLIHKKIFRTIIIFMVIGVLFSAPFPVFAHPADMYFQTLSMTFGEQEIMLDWTITPGPMLAPSIWYEADTNNNNKIEETEAKDWLEPHIQKLTANINGIPLDKWKIQKANFPFSLPAFEIGDEKIEIQLTAAYPAELSDQNIVQMHNQFNESISINWYYLYGDEDFSFSLPEQSNGTLAFTLIDLTRTESSDSLEESLSHTYWDSGIPSMPVSLSQSQITQPDTPQQPNDTRPVTRLTNMLREENVSLTFFLSAVFIAILLGALHALTPGHGKAIVAAYLIGSKGTIKHAVFLGSIVTITHTGSVFLLGIITMLASRYIMPMDIFPYLEIISGLLIAILGISLFIQRWRNWKNNILSPQKYNPEKLNLATNDQTTGKQDKSEDKSRIKINEQITEQGPKHKHPNIPDPGQVSVKSIIALGISGGIVPCPDAISILLIAVLINRIFLGLSLIFAFSLGLAVILIAIGLVMVNSQRFFIRFDRENRIAPITSLFSAFIVFGLGIVLVINSIQYNNLLANSQSFEALNKNTNQDSRILFTVLGENNTNQLYTTDISENNSETPVTQAPLGIWDYSVSPDGNWIIYSIPRQECGNDVHLMSSDFEIDKTILECPDATCTNAAWSPNGQQVIYERLGFSSQNAVIGVPSLWWLDINSGETKPVFQDGELPGSLPNWSPDNKWISYSTPGNSQVQFYNLTNGKSFSLSSQSGGVADWSPSGNAFLLTDVQQQGDGYAIHLFVYSIEDSSMLDLTDGTNSQDSTASWSPDGEWLAIVRRSFASSKSMSGDNIWLCRPDGSGLLQLTHQDAAYHSQPVWSPDSRYIIFHRYLILEKDLRSGIWMIDVESGQEIQVTEEGTRPFWLD